MEANKRALTMKLKMIPKESLERSTEAWKKRMEKCLTLEGENLKGKCVMFDFKVKYNFCDTSPLFSHTSQINFYLWHKKQFEAVSK